MCNLRHVGNPLIPGQSGFSFAFRRFDRYLSELSQQSIVMHTFVLFCCFVFTPVCQSFCSQGGTHTMHTPWDARLLTYTPTTHALPQMPPLPCTPRLHAPLPCMPPFLQKYGPLPKYTLHIRNRVTLLLGFQL